MFVVVNFIVIEKNTYCLILLESFFVQKTMCTQGALVILVILGLIEYEQF